MAYNPQPWDIASVELFGRRLPNGQIAIGIQANSPNVFDDFPAEIQITNLTYKLEKVKRNRDLYNLAPGHAGYNIEWGVYC